MRSRRSFFMTKLPVVILISGRGSNLQAIIDACREHELPIEIRAVISNNPHAAGLERARRAGLPATVIDHRAFAERDAFDTALMQAVDQYAPGLVVLAGFMRILGAEFIAHYAGRLMNIHPSLLPALPGLNTHARALASGAKQHGATVHFVTDEVDAGAVIVRAPVAILPGDTRDSLAARVLQEEHRIYPLAIRWFAEGRLQLNDNGVVVKDGAVQH